MLDEPLLGDCELQLVGFEDAEARRAFHHSSAHILGFAIEQIFQESLLTIGPPVNEGFFYDFHYPSGQVVRDDDYKEVEKVIKQIVKKNLKFEKLILSKEQALDMFSYNRFKTELIQKKVSDDQLTSVFRIGDFIDLCTGPHVQTTRAVKALKVMKHS